MLARANNIDVSTLSDDQFRRLTGIKKLTFKEMILVLKDAERIKKKDGGRPNKLTIETQLIMCLEHLREYRTYFHIGKSYGVSEVTVLRICRWIEDILIKSKKFSLPGKKKLLKSDVEYEVILVDTSESPIERPKKRRG